MNNIINVLKYFYLPSGLKLNINKSNLFGIVNELEDMARLTGYTKEMLPFKYRDLPVGSNMVEKTI